MTVPDVNTTAVSIGSSVNTVPFDLNRFAIIGPVSCEIDVSLPGSPTVCNAAADDPSSVFGPGVGIRATVNESLTIKNGTIRGMGRYGIFVSGGPYVIVENVHARENALGGIWPSVAVVINSMAANNGDFGIRINQGLVKGSIIARNVGSGIVSTGQPLNIQDTQINRNGGFGIDFSSAGGAIGNNMIYGNVAGAISGGTPIETTENYCTGTGCVP